MVRTLPFIGALVALALAGCGDAGDGGTNVTVPGPEETQARLEAMPEGQRNAVFIRAIRDADQPCQHVESSRAAGEDQGYPVWAATCDGGAEYRIVIQNDGTASVLGTADARLVGDNAAGPAGEKEAQ